MFLSAETKIEKQVVVFFLKKNGICLFKRSSQTNCVLHPKYNVQLDSGVNIMAFICVVYASIQRYCSKILTYL